MALPPLIVPLNPLAGGGQVDRRQAVTLEIVDPGGAGITPSTINVAIDGVAYVTAGVLHFSGGIGPLTGAEPGYLLTLDPAHFPGPQGLWASGATLTVSVTASTTGGTPGALGYAFQTVTGTRLLEVLNPSDGVLVVRFSGPLRQTDALFDPGNWDLEPVSPTTSLPLTVTAAAGNERNPDTVVLLYTGGGTTYTLTVGNGLLDEEGLSLEPGFVSATVAVPILPDGQQKIRLFNSIYGPLGMTKQSKGRRTVDRLVINRSIAVATDVQFQLRLQALNDGTLARSGAPGAAKLS